MDARCTKDEGELAGVRIFPAQQSGRGLRALQDADAFALRQSRQSAPFAFRHSNFFRHSSFVIRHFLLFLFLAASSLPAADTNAVLTAWLNAQTNIQSWSAEFTQTRTLKALTEPLTARGRVWFVAPNRFRWELGDPAETIAVRQAEQMLVIYPKLKRAEKYPLTGDAPGRWRDTLALLEAGFPRHRTDLDSRFRLTALAESADAWELTLQPKSASARRLMPQIKIAFAKTDYALRATELTFTDGSTMRNDFVKPVLNLKIDDTLFAPKLADDVKLVEPLKKK
ncbi:MAG: outer membrane lipoprotein carrier protein LolA [Verrucomicrobiota bacterium]